MTIILCAINDETGEVLNRDGSVAGKVTCWQPIETAEKRAGSPETVLLWVPELHGTGGPILAHWAFGGGEDQPAFGPAWFYWSYGGFSQLPENCKPTHWMSLPKSPADWRKPFASRVDLSGCEVKK